MYDRAIVSFKVSTVVKLYVVESNILAMPCRCAACKMVGENEHSLHLFPKIERV